HPENGSLIQQRIDELHDSLALDASRYVPILENLLVLASAGSDVTDAQSNYLKSTRTYLISGWLPVSRRQNIIRNIRARTRALFFIDEERPEGIAAVRQRRQKVPVLLDNPKFLQPFELLLTAFGLPEYYAVDPTIFVAVSYLIMFGVMFGDIGHGTVLGISGYIFSRKAGGMLSAFGILAAYCGGAAIVFGFLYGKFFGLALLNPLWRDPFDDVSRFLMTAVIGGLVMINAGILLHGANAWKSRNIFASVQDRGSGQGLIQAVQSIIKIMEAVLRYAVNALSFARVAAFALAHAGLLMAVFDLAEMVQQAVGVAGSTAVLILGNIFIIFFEGMIVAIQALRLEYYEFFSRFFEPSGEPYRPVKFNPIT
ncbi:MAG: hypothetical protein KGJ11_01840, partial [Candidatus Omnitrophica bacterium]|nr:hypothetical protein [Candidatus Omnitrophota bacterium]